MRRRTLAKLFALLGASLSVPAMALAARGALPAPSLAAACAARETGVPATRLAALARGVNLTGWLDARPGVAPDPAALKGLRARGLTHLRLPVAAELYLAELSGNGPATTQMSKLAQAVDDLIRLGFSVSLDMHPGAEIGALKSRDPERARVLIEGLWRDLARRFADRSPERLFFELLNEPERPAEYAWSVGFGRVVRAIAPSHTLILGPPLWQRIEALEELTPLADRNVVYAIHVYDPMAFTHQGQDWAAEDDPLRAFAGVPYPSRLDHPAVRALEARLIAEGKKAAAANLAGQMAEPWDAAAIERIFARADTWATRLKVPVIVNEFGVLAWRAPPADRVRWLADVRTAAERHCIGWTHWDYADAFGLMRRSGGRETPDPAVLDALVPPVIPGPRSGARNP